MSPRLLLRLHRIGLIAMAYFGIFYVLVNSAAFPLIAGKTRAAQEAFGHSVTVLGATFSWLLPLPIRPDTAAGYLQWRGYGFFAIIFAAWGVFSACGAVRRDEDRGLVESWLSTGVSRLRLLATRSMFFAVVSAGIVALTGGAGWLGCLIAGTPADVAGLVGESAALWALTLACFGLGLLVAQLVGEFRAAAAAGSALLVLMFLLDSIGRSSVHRGPLSGISVFFLFNQSNAVAPGGSFDPTATLLLFVVGAVATAAAGAAFVRRDLGSGLVRQPPRRATEVHDPSSNPLLRVPVARGLWIRRAGTLAWTVGMGVLAAAVVLLVNTTATFFATTPSLSPYLRGLAGDVHTVLLALIWLSFAQALVAILSITTVSRWSADDSSGVLEMQLAEPLPRWGVLVERATELTVTVTVMSFVAMAVILALAPAEGIGVDAGKLLIATALLIPFALTFAAVGALLAGWRPRVAVVVLSTVGVISYLVFELGPLFKWPKWADNLSVFQLYGTPLITPVFVGGLIAMLAIVVVGFGSAGVALARRDVAA
jgi:ABC-type transport system involved in multi-copper enzyme maturation permease subunit